MRPAESALRGARLLDVDAALGGTDHPQPVTRGVNHDGEIAFLARRRLLDETRIDRVPLQPMPQHAVHRSRHILRRAATYHATRLAAAANRHLRLHDPR